MAFTIKQSDTSPAIRANLKDADGFPINLTQALVRFHMKDLSGNLIIDKPMIVVNEATGLIRYNWEPSDTAVAGTYYAEIEVSYGDNSIETFPNTGNLAIIITPELN